MRHLPRPLKHSLVALALAGCLGLGYQAAAVRSTAPKQVTAAVVDLERLYSNLNEMAELQARLKTLGEEMEEERHDREEAIRLLREDMESFAPGSEKYQQLENDYVQQSIEYEAWLEFKRRQLDREKGVVLRKVYQSVKTSVADMAAREGYDLVLLNDSLSDLAAGGESSVNQQISSRRILYSNPTIDITDDLLTRMNNQFNASSG